MIVDHDHFGDGYGVLTDECTLTRFARVARTEGILLDPVYSGKAMAALLDVAGRRPDRRG